MKERKKNGDKMFFSFCFDGKHRELSLRKVLGFFRVVQKFLIGEKNL